MLMIKGRELPRKDYPEGQVLRKYKFSVDYSLDMPGNVHRPHPLLDTKAITMVSFTYLALAASAVFGAVAAPAPEPYSSEAPDFEVGPHNWNLTRRQDYNQNYKTGGNVNFQPTNNGYSVSFSNAGDFVVGKGWRTGTTR